MNIAAAIAGILLGLCFLFASGSYFVETYVHHFMDMPAPPAGSPAAMFFGAFAPTHYLDFIKALELLGAILVAIPRTRRIGLVVLGPIIVNILAFHTFITDPKDLINPVIIVIVATTLFLVWVERKAFAAYVRGG